MRCPQCEREFRGQVLDHLNECSVDPQRLYNVGLIDLEELESINNIKRDVDAPPLTKQ